MRRLMLWMMALAALSGGAAQAQNITGAWQGTLEAGQQKLRIVFTISLDNDKLKATMNSIDQPQSPALPANSVTKDGATVKIALTGIATYEGKLSADGNAMTGTWTQGAPLTLNLVKATKETAWTIPEPPPPPTRMAANANAVFTVATIKPSAPNRPGKLYTVRGPDVLTMNTTLKDLITMAYDLHPRQLTGLPGWAETDKYDITGRPEAPGQPSVDQMKIMIQKLLAERFQLKFHREKKELPAYAITVLKTGSKLAKSQADPNSLPGLFFGGANPGVSFNVRNGSIAEAAAVLQGNLLDKPVVDQTGLAGKFDFTVKFTPDAGQIAAFGAGPQGAAPAAEALDAPPDLFTAFQQQLGLKMESTKAPVDVLVLDKVEKPSEN